MRKEFERVYPGEAGVSADAIHWLLDQLENGFTEPHGLMIMRHGKICAEGWWAPYAPGIRHGLQSHSKAYTATAIGIAVQEGIVRLDEKIADIFRDKLSDEPSENLLRMTVHDVLCMGCGMEEERTPEGDWIKNFLAVPVRHEPGTSFMYNTTGTSLLGAVIQKKTGESLQEYLTGRLFDKIGIDASNIRWFYMPDGLEAGGGGMFAALEDNLRLMKLYADGGVWEGERILPEEFVRKAISVQIDSSPEKEKCPAAADNFLGYGYQLWKCRPEGAYRADGAKGQFTVVLPKQDMIISILETTPEAHWAQETLDVLWEFAKRAVLDETPGSADCKIHKEEYIKVEGERLRRRMKMLSLPAPEYRDWRIGDVSAASGRYRITDGSVEFAYYGNVMPLLGCAHVPQVTELSFEFDRTDVQICYPEGETEKTIHVEMDGSYRENRMKGQMPSRILASGYWKNAQTLAVELRWIETCDVIRYEFTFRNDRILIEWERDELFAVKKHRAGGVKENGYGRK